jgi:hypothetical protein
LEAQQHKKYAQTTPLDDGVSSLFLFTIDTTLCKIWKTFVFEKLLKFLKS